MVNRLKALCTLDGVSGNEQKVRAYIQEELKNVVDEMTVDTMGNLHIYKKGKKSGQKILLTANMDESGFIASGITEQGFIQFKNIGAIDSRVLISKRVRIGETKGVIGMKAIHLQQKEEREHTVPVKNLFIDIGAENKENAQKIVKLGQYIAFDTKYALFGTGKIKAKALSSRAACAILIALLQETLPCEISACFTVQHEVGARGSKIAAVKQNADTVITISGIDSGDTYQTKSHDLCCRLSKGAVIEHYNRGLIPNQKKTEQIFQLCREKNIKIQQNRNTEHRNDGRGLQTALSGCSMVSIGIPVRYMHTPVGIVDLDDVAAAKQTVLTAIELLLNQ